MAITSTYYFIKNGKLDPTIKITELLLADTHDLIHKACGWMLRELGKRSRSTLDVFLSKHASGMPRTMLRYAIEKHSAVERAKYLNKEFRSKK